MQMFAQMSMEDAIKFSKASALKVKKEQVKPLKTQNKRQTALPEKSLRQQKENRSRK